MVGIIFGSMLVEFDYVGSVVKNGGLGMRNVILLERDVLELVFGRIPLEKCLFEVRCYVELKQGSICKKYGKQED